MNDSSVLSKSSNKWMTPFFTMWTGQVFSLFGSSLVQFAIVWHLTQKTGSATVLATATLAAVLPGVLLGPFVGAIVDRNNRKRMMIFSDGTTALITLGMVILAALNHLEVWEIYVGMFLRSFVSSFQYPAMSASTSLMVPQEHLSRIAGLNQALRGAMNIVAPPFGALIIGLIPFHWVLSIDCVTALMAIIPLFFVRIPQPEKALVQSVGVNPVKVLWGDVKEGMRYIWSWSGLFGLLVIASVINFFENPAFTLLPLLVTKHFHGDAIHYGWMESGFGIGVVAGGLILSVWGGFKKRTVTSISALIVGSAALAAVGFVSADGYWIALSMIVTIGLLNPIINGPLQAIIQAKVAPEKQGRVMTLVESIATAMMPLSMVIAGPVADRFGIQSWFILGGGVCVLLGIVILFIPAIMDIESHQDQETGAVTPSISTKGLESGTD